ncbi:putative ribonuclease H-like domain-containing protein [Tanacetum coccineum]
MGNSKKRVHKGKDGSIQGFPPTTQEELFVMRERKEKGLDHYANGYSKDHPQHFEGHLLYRLRESFGEEMGMDSFKKTPITLDALGAGQNVMIVDLIHVSLVKLRSGFGRNGYKCRLLWTAIKIKKVEFSIATILGILPREFSVQVLKSPKEVDQLGRARLQFLEERILALMAFTVNNEIFGKLFDCGNELNSMVNLALNLNLLATVSNACSIVFSSAIQYSDGELGAVSYHASSTHYFNPIGNSKEWIWDLGCRIFFGKKTMFCSCVEVLRQARPAWTIIQVNNATKITPRPVQISNIRPNFSTASRTIKTGRVNVNTGKQNVSSGSLHVSSGTQIKSGTSRFNTGKQHVNSVSVHVNSGTQFKSGASRFNTDKQHVNSGCGADHPLKPIWDIDGIFFVGELFGHMTGIMAQLEDDQELCQSGICYFWRCFLKFRASSDEANIVAQRTLHADSHLLPLFWAKVKQLILLALPSNRVSKEGLSILMCRVGVVEELLVVSSTSRKAAVSDNIAKRRTHSPKQPSSTPISKTSTLAPVYPLLWAHIEDNPPSDDHEEEVFSDADDDEMPEIRIYDKSSEGIFEQASYDDDGIITDFNNLPDEVDVSTNHTLRIHNAHPQSQILGDPNTPVQTRSSLKKITEAHALVSYIQAHQRSNHKDQQHCLFACFLSQFEPRKVLEALEDGSGLKLLQDITVAVQASTSMVLVDLPYGARLVAQGHRQEEGIDYDEVFAPVARIEVQLLMQSRFQMSSMGELTFFLGLQVKQNKGGIFISQDKYVAEILKKFDLVNVKAAITPMETKLPLTKDEEAFDVDVHLYRSMIGNSKDFILNAVKRIFKYLKGKPNLGLWYPRDSPLHLEAFSDSDYGGSNLDRKSTTAAANCWGQVLGSKIICWTIGSLLILKSNIDNESTICIVKNPVYHSKTKHIEIRHHFIRDCYEKKLINVEKIHTDLNVADLLTKPFDGPRFNYLVVSIGFAWMKERRAKDKDNACSRSILTIPITPPHFPNIYISPPPIPITTPPQFPTPYTTILLQQPTHHLHHHYQPPPETETNQNDDEEPEAQGRKKVKMIPQESSITRTGLHLQKQRHMLQGREHSGRYKAQNTLEAAKTSQRFDSLSQGPLTKEGRCKRKKETKGKKVIEVNMLSKVNTGSIELITVIELEKLVLQKLSGGFLTTQRRRLSKFHLDALLAQRIAEEVESDCGATEEMKSFNACVGSELQGEDFAKRMVDLEDESTKKIWKEKKRQMARKGVNTSIDENDFDSFRKVMSKKGLTHGEKGVYQIVREDGTDIVYINFGAMLKSISRDDLTELYRIVMNRYGVDGPEDKLEKGFWKCLRTMFEEPLSTDSIWSKLGQQKIISWRYYDTCRVHCLNLESMDVYMLSERKYPLSAVGYVN